MKINLCQHFENNSHISIGAVKSDHVIDFSNSQLPSEMIEFIKLGEEGLDKAKIYVSADDADINNDVMVYKERLIIHKYKHDIIINQFDTTITKQQIATYYKNYPLDFDLNHTIIRGRFVVIDINSVNVEQIETMINRDDKNSLDKLEDLCRMYSKNYFLNDSIWLVLSDFTHSLTISEKQMQKILSVKNKIHSFTDKNYRYVIYINDYQIKGDRSPLSFVFKNIRELLKNKNRVSFINNLEDEIYQEALSSGDIRVYIQ